MMKRIKGLPWQPVPGRAGTRILTWINEEGDAVDDVKVDKEEAITEGVQYEDTDKKEEGGEGAE